MPIAPLNNVQQAILNITASPANYPADSTAVANAWADVADVLLAQVVPASTTSVAARQAFVAIMSGINPTIPNGLTLMENAFMAYAAQIGVGMAPAFTATPPPTPPPIAITLNVPLDAQTAAGLLASVLETWAHTGTATNVSSGVTSGWQ